MNIENNEVYNIIKEQRIVANLLADLLLNVGKTKLVAYTIVGSNDDIKILLTS